MILHRAIVLIIRCSRCPTLALRIAHLDEGVGARQLANGTVCRVCGDSVARPSLGRDALDAILCIIDRQGAAAGEVACSLHAHGLAEGVPSGVHRRHRNRRNVAAVAAGPRIPRLRPDRRSVSDSAVLCRHRRPHLRQRGLRRQRRPVGLPTLSQIFGVAQRLRATRRRRTRSRVAFRVGVGKRGTACRHVARDVGRRNRWLVGTVIETHSRKCYEKNEEPFSSV